MQCVFIANLFSGSFQNQRKSLKKFIKEESETFNIQQPVQIIF